MQSRQAIRSSMRALRRRLTSTEHARHSRTICATIRSLGAFRRARTIAIYFGFDGEPLVHGLLRSAAATEKHFYAPVIGEHEMRFASVHAADRLAANDFGIVEPTTNDYIDTRYLDLVLTPLVAFDARGTRLGIGAGYYDRCFDFLAHRHSWHRPRLLGVAHSFQEAAAIPAADWDVPLWGIVTEKEYRVFPGE